MWETERDLSQYILHKIAEGVHKTRIETHSTRSGVPDAYISTESVDFWIEFKNMKTKSIHDDKWKVAWRPGQQDWLVSNKIITYSDYAAMHRCNYTIIGCSDGIVICRMFHRFYNNVVEKNTAHVYTFDSKFLSRMKPVDFTHWLMYHCYYVSCRYILRINKEFTLREAAKRLIHEYLDVYHAFGFNMDKDISVKSNVNFEYHTDCLLENVGKQDEQDKKMSCLIQNDDVINMQVEALDMAAHIIDYEAKKEKCDEEEEE